MSVVKTFSRGLYEQNPVFKQALGLCPTLAVTGSVINGLGMGLAATFVLICSNLLISAIRKGVPPRIRIPIYIVVIASFVTVVDLSMAGFMPDLHKSLGIFVPLIVVNCLILGRAESFAGKNNVGLSFIDGLGMGIGFTFALVLLGAIRELLGNGSLLGIPMGFLGANFEPVLIMILPPGAFLSIGFVLGFFNWLENRRKTNS
ncbi:RnfABCDGE type electron transport complex subunit E [candidate division KSB1 bacterium]|jgi:electron transport complex protein RnfE|nr:RnfABCDGE type electron transport complex subunit E [candidate division KSB1 bacterium]